MLENKWMTLDRVPVDDVVKELDTLIREGERVLHIGTDAQKVDKRVDFVTCIVALKPKKGGKVYYTRVRKGQNDVKSLRQKLFTEAWMSCETAMELAPHIPENTQVFVHLDVNPDEKWASSKHIKEIVGMVVGQGYEVLVKPDSWCASHAADHAVKNKNHRELRSALKRRQTQRARKRKGKK